MKSKKKTIFCFVFCFNRDAYGADQAVAEAVPGVPP
jgi:hypothetical protein